MVELMVGRDCGMSRMAQVVVAMKLVKLCSLALLLPQEPEWVCDWHFINKVSGSFKPNLAVQ